MPPCDQVGYSGFKGDQIVWIVVGRDKFIWPGCRGPPTRAQSQRAPSMPFPDWQEHQAIVGFHQADEAVGYSHGGKKNIKSPIKASLGLVRSAGRCRARAESNGEGRHGLPMADT